MLCICPIHDGVLFSLATMSEQDFEAVLAVCGNPEDCPPEIASHRDALLTDPELKHWPFL